MSKLQDKLFGKVTIRKKLTMTTAVVFFLVLSMFTLVVVFSANTLLLQRERQNVNNTIAKVVTYIEKDWDSDEELSPEPLLAALYSPKNIYASIINGVLSEKHSLDGQVAISNKLYSNQSVFVYDKKGTFIFTSEENTDSPPGMSEVNKLKSVSYKGKRGFLLQVPIYGKDKKTIVGYAQIFHDLEFYYALKERLVFLLIFLEVGMTVLVIAATVVVLTSILRPMRQLHETMGVITDSPSDLELRSKIESHDEIGDLAVNFNRMMDKIQENNQMQMRFLSDVSHELRTPIAVIKGHMDLLQRWGKNDPEILEESLEAASHEANRMTIMINDMLDSIRVKGSFENHRNDTCDLNSSIRTVIGNFRVLHEDYQFYLNDFESSERPAQIYSQHFEQAITILIDNAVKVFACQQGNPGYNQGIWKMKCWYKCKITVRGFQKKILIIFLNASIVQIRHVTVRQHNLVLVLVCQSFTKLWKLIAAVSMLVLNLVLEHVSTFTFHLRIEKRRYLNLSFKSIYKRLRVILGREHASFRACFLCVFMVK